MTPTALTCPGCDSALPGGASTCPECGEDLAPLLRLEMEPYLLYNQGLSLVQSGDLDGAVLKLRSAMAAMPAEPGPYVVLGKIYAQMGDWAQARRWWEAALRRWPGDPAAQQGLQALEAHRTAAEVAARKESVHQRRRRWLSSAAYFATGGLLVAFLIVARDSFRGSPQSPPATPAALAAASTQTITATFAPSPVLGLPTVTSVPTQTQPPPTPTATPTASPSPAPGLASQVESAIRSHPLLAGPEIRVEQQGNAVLLQGEVPSIVLKSLLEAVAEGVPKVDLVDTSGLRVVHKVKPGDTLSHISLQMYGQTTLWPLIANANELANPHRIYPGQRLIIPPPR